MLKLKLQYFGHLMWRADSLEKTLMLGGIWTGGERDDREWDGWMASPTRWTWVWVNSGSWWWTGRPSVLWFMGSQSRTRLSDWTELRLPCCRVGKCYEQLVGPEGLNLVWLFSLIAVLSWIGPLTSLDFSHSVSTFDNLVSLAHKDWAPVASSPCISQLQIIIYPVVEHITGAVHRLNFFFFIYLGLSNSPNNPRR